MLTILVSVVEIISIGAVLPFLSIFTNPEVFFNHPLILQFRNLFNINSSQQLLFYFASIFVLALILTGAMRTLHLWINARVSNAIGSDLSSSIFKSFLKKPYSEIVDIKSSEVINGVLTKVDRVTMLIILPWLNFVSSLIIMFFILSLLIYININITLISMSSIGIVYFLISALTKKKLLSNSKYIAFSSDKIVQLIQESKGTIKDIIIGRMHSNYFEKFRNLDWRYRYLHGVNLVISQSPRFIIEAIGASIIVIIAYIISINSNNPGSVLPSLGVLVFAMQRILPLVQIIYRSWSSIQAGQASFYDVIELMSDTKNLNISIENKLDVTFQKEISLKNVSFKHSNKKNYLFKDVNLKINSGTFVGIVGKSGSGKTTLIDLIMGLLTPSKGDILVDNLKIDINNISSWQSCISHVPQEVFLVDASIAENIALGVSIDEINEEKLKESIYKAQLNDLVNNLPNKEATRVGESGALISGGQRQRIAIARALYSDAKVFIFDEATSALDQKTEKELIQVFNSFKNEILFIMVTHRLNSLSICDQIIDLDKINN